MRAWINPYGEGENYCITPIIEDHDLWSLDYTLALIIHPALIRFKEMTKSRPMALSEEEWDQILDKMIVAFEIIVEDEVEASPDIAREKQKVISEGLELFGKWYQDLWS